MNKKPLHYLASPIKHDNPMVVNMRHSQCVDAVGQFYHHGWMVYSPHLHHFPIADRMPKTWDFWAEPSFAFLDRCESMIVLMLGDWEKSQGIKAEMERAKDQHKTILMVDYPLKWNSLGLDCTSVSFGIYQKKNVTAELLT